MQVQPTHYAYPIESGVLFTLRVMPAAIKEQWITCPKEMSTSLNVLPRGWPSGTPGDERKSLHRPPVLQFYLPLSVLNAFTDSHGMVRVSPVNDIPPFVCPTFVRLTQLLIPSLERSYPFSSSFMNQFVLLFCAHVVQHRTTGNPELIIHKGGLSAWQKKRTIELLSTGNYENARLRQLARECDISVSHFSRAFKLSFGMPVHKWIVTQRIERAKQLLTETNEALLSIAQETGFADQASFNRTFAKVTGISPGRWRRYFRV
jgi:AraC-like DNA-binding protein